MFAIEKDTHASSSYIIRSDAKTESALMLDMPGIWKSLLDLVEQCRPARDWSRLYFEMWITDGYTIAYPHNRSDSSAAKRPEITIRSTFFDDLAAILSQMDQPTYDEKYGLHAVYYSQAIYGTYRKQPAISAVKALRSQHDFTVFKMDEDDTETMSKVELIY